MLYKLLNRLFKFTQFIYFKKVVIEGVDKINFKEANLLISNHPSAFKDPILIGSNFSNPIYFLAAEEFMGGEKMSLFLEGQFNMIPIYRPTTQPNEIHKNTGSFEKCYQALNDKKSILIFAEGHSETQSWLDPLKTGTARITLETLVRFPDLQKINIVPIGLNYSNPHEFRSNFHLKIGDIIEVEQGNKFDKTELTNLAHKHLRLSINGLDKEEADWQTILLDIFNQNYDLSIEESHNANQAFILELSTLDSEKFLDLKKQTQLLSTEVEKIDESIKDFVQFKNFKNPNLFATILAVILFIPGFLLNFIPIYILKYFVKNKDVKYSFEGSMKFAFGVVFILVWHILAVASIAFVIGWFSLMLPIFMLFFGWITLVCRDYLLPSYKNQFLKSVFSKNKKLSLIYSEIENQLKPLKESKK